MSTEEQLQYNSGIGEMMDSMQSSLKGDIADAQQQITKLQGSLRSDSMSNNNNRQDIENSLSEYYSVESLVSKISSLKRKLQEVTKASKRREHEQKNLVEVQIQMLKAELRMSQQVTNRVGDPNRRTLQQTQFIPCRSLRPNSRMGRDEYLSTRRTQEFLDQKLSRAMSTACDVSARNEALMSENSKLREEVSRLRQENTDLLLFAKDSQTDAHVLRAQVVTNVAHRASLLKRLSRTSQQKQDLESNLTSLANRFVLDMQEEALEEELDRWAQIDDISSQSRSITPRSRRSMAKTSRSPIFVNNVGIAIEIGFIVVTTNIMGLSLINLIAEIFEWRIGEILE
eukprot:gene7713-610_t